MKRLSILFLIFALSYAAKLNIPTSYTAEIISKWSEDGNQYKAIFKGGSDGSREHLVSIMEINGTETTSESFIFKSNSTAYIIKSVSGPSCSIVGLSEVDAFFFEKLNKEGKGPGDNCTGPAGKSGSLWEHSDNIFCVSEDGTTPYYAETSTGKKVRWPITFTAQAPATNTFQLPAICIGGATEGLNLAKAYSADSKTEYSGYIKMGNVTRHENGDSVVMDFDFGGSEVYFITSEQKLYAVRHWLGGCTAHNETYNFTDEISSIIENSISWTKTQGKCLDGEGEVWAKKQSNDTLCTKSNGTVPVQYKSDSKVVTWTNFRTNDLPAIKLPKECKSA